MVHPGRISHNNVGTKKDGPIVYWMNRDQRSTDNWAIAYSIELATQRSTFVIVVFCLDLSYHNTTARTVTFMLEGLKVVETSLASKQIPFFLLQGDPTKELPTFLKNLNASILITDFDPLRIKQQWKESIIRKVTIPVITVDAHNIVPCQVASSKQEFGAYTIRPKINKFLVNYIQDFPELKEQKTPKELITRPINWPEIININESIPSITWIKPGEHEAKKALRYFIEHKLEGYATKRNLPELGWTSNLSPYFHFGHIAPQRVALEIIKANAPVVDKDAFLEEMIVRRELSDNYCFYNPNYDTIEGLPAWAKTTLNIHRSDEREHIYSLDAFENANTHDKLWNAAQNEMVHTGKMHGYLRMYWAKKILEWTASPEDAFSIAIFLNDKYSLDGQDPNGYAGIAWAIGGLHDRAWFERPVYGKIRYMNSNGAQRKFNVAEYISKNSF